MKHVKSKTQRDKLLIEALVWRYGPISRADIHELTHLQRSNISRLVKQLLAEGRILPAGRADNPMGRKQLLLRLNEEQGFVLAVGFDDEQVLAATMDLHLSARSTVARPAALDKGESGFISQLLSCAREALREAGVGAKSLVGIGVAGSGLVNTREGLLVMSTTVEFLREVPLREIFEKEFGVPTAIENLTRAKTVAERALGAGSMARDMIYVEYGRTGIGAGIVLDGRLFYGSGYMAGEFGHPHIIEDGPACKCGSFGCLAQPGADGRQGGACRGLAGADELRRVLEVVVGETLHVGLQNEVRGRRPLRRQPCHPPATATIFIVAP